MTEPKRKTPQTRQKPLHVIRVNDVRATVFARQSNMGFPYLDFELSRSWKSLSSGKEVSGASFFTSHEKDILEAVRQASTWISAQSIAAATTPPHSSRPC